MGVRTASRRAEFKALPTTDGTPDGVVEALVSVFNVVDEIGDKVLPGAFTDTLAEWAAKGDPIPFIWSHQWGNPDAHIGVITKAEETPDGLLVTAQLDLDRPFAAQVFHLLKERRVTQFSFGYEAKEYAWVRDTDSTFGEIRELRKVSIFEAGPTLLGMNPETDLIRAASRPEPDQTPPTDSQTKSEDNPPCDDPATIALEQRAAELMAKTRHTEE
jgi:HK97 family phage prohead protease